jgi:hypothetical protein
VNSHPPAGGVLGGDSRGRAAREGRVLETNPDSGQVTNARVPDEYIRPTYRSGRTL